MKLSSIDTAIQTIRDGGFVIVVDSENRENEGDVVLAAAQVTPEKINFMITHARGLICVPMLGSRLDELKLPLMTNGQAIGNRCAFTISVDARYNSTTGISAADRATTIQVLIDKKSKPDDLLRPGHMFPLRYREGGVLVRQGHTEASVDLAKLAGLYPAGVICEVMNADGTMAKLPQLLAFGKKHNIPVITIDNLIAYLHEKKLVIH